MILVNKNAKGTPLPHMWNACVGAGRAKEGLRADWQKQLEEAVKECGFRYVRFHGLLAEDMFVYSEIDGQPVYNWRYIDALYDALLEIGIRPFVEFSFMPPQLASADGTLFWWKANVTPPESYEKWAALIQALVEHWKERYGLEEIRNWYYEIWNEPDLHAFWHGTKSQYFELYRVSVQAIKSVDDQLRVGGPATSNFVPDDRFAGEVEDISKQVTHRIDDLDSLSWKGVWIEDFLNYCAKKGLPVDFVSTHPYPTDFALDGQQEMKGRSRCADSIRMDMEWLAKTVRNSAYPQAELWLTEWSSSPTSRDYSHDYLPAADYIIKSYLDCDGLADALSYWVFTDIFEEEGGGPMAFHGGFGLMNLHGIKKPAYHAYRLLHELGTEEIDRGDGYIWTKTPEGNLSGLFYNYGSEMKQAVPISYYPDHAPAERIEREGDEKEFCVRITGLAPYTAVEMELLDREHSVACCWGKMGYPSSLTRAQEKVLKETLPEKKILRADQQGNLEITVILEAWAIMSLREL